MKELELKNIDPGDVEDLLVKVEASFHIQLASKELADLRTFGEMCDYIKGKIQLEQTDDCSKQQAFYKLRRILSYTLKVDKEEITRHTLLKVLLPRQTRRLKISEIEKNLGFKIALLRPPHAVIWFLTLLLLVSFVILFFNWQFGLIGFGVAIGGLWFTSKVKNELKLNTVGELAEKMTRENYLKSRSNPNTYNKDEIERVLTEWFKAELDIKKLTRESRLT